MGIFKNKEEEEAARAGQAEPGASKAESSRPEKAKEQKHSAPSSNQKVAKAKAKSVEERFGYVRSALGKGTVIQGKLSFDNPVRIDGKLGGEIFSTDTLIVGPDGIIDAQLKVKSLIVMGTVKGTINAAERVELLSGGKLEGDVKAAVFVVEENSVFNGNCAMGKAEQQPAQSASPQLTKEVAEQAKQVSNRPNEKSAPGDSKEASLH